MSRKVAGQSSDSLMPLRCGEWGMEVPAAVRERLSGGLGTVLPSKACPNAPPPSHGGKLMPAFCRLLL